MSDFKQATPSSRQKPKGFSGLLVFAAAVVLAVIASILLSTTAQLPREAAMMGGIFVLAAVLWVTEAVPLFATSLLVISLQAVLLANPGGWSALGFESGKSPTYRSIFAAAADPVLVLFFGGFVLAQAAVKEGVDRTVSAILLRPFGSNPRWALLGIMLVTQLFGMWMSNTATTAMMLALAGPQLLALSPTEPFRKALILAIPFAANISGISTPIGSPPNAVALGYLQEGGKTVAFVDWMIVATPLAIALLLFTWVLLWKMFPPTTAGLKIEYSTTPLTARGRGVIAVFAVTVLLWMTDALHGIPASVVALLPAVILTSTGLFSRDDLGKIEWRVLILIAGGISLGSGMQLTSLDKFLVTWLPSGGGNAIWLLAILVIGTIVVTTFISNTAAANLFLPIAISAAGAGGADGLNVVQAAVSIALAASISMLLPISTPPNALAYATGEITTRDMARAGFIISIVAAAAIIFGSRFILKLWGVI